mgnify:CR=1 FL=1
MPASTWNARDERQYRAIVKNCRSGLKTCKRIAAATVNKRRARGLGDLSGTPLHHEFDAASRLRALRTPYYSGVPTCLYAIRAREVAEVALYAAKESGNKALLRSLKSMNNSIRDAIEERCRESVDGRPVPLSRDYSLEMEDEEAAEAARKKTWALNGLEKAEYMLTRGFKEGRKSWIDVMPAGGPRMRVTHEVLESLGALTKEQKNKRHRANYTARRDRKASQEEHWQTLAQKDNWKHERRSIDKNDAESWDPRSDFEGLGSSLALMWAAAGAVALIVLSDAQKAGASQSSAAPDPAAMIIRADLNRARAAQGLPLTPR